MEMRSEMEERESRKDNRHSRWSGLGRVEGRGERRTTWDGCLRGGRRWSRGRGFAAGDHVNGLFADLKGGECEGRMGRRLGEGRDGGRCGGGD